MGDESHTSGPAVAGPQVRKGARILPLKFGCVSKVTNFSLYFRKELYFK